jgi:hypothetical protein
MTRLAVPMPLLAATLARQHPGTDSGGSIVATLSRQFALASYIRTGIIHG